MRRYVVPLSPVWFRRQRVFRSKGYFTEKIQEAINEDPEIEESTNISVNVEKGSIFRAHRLQLIGEVHSQKDKDRAEELVRKQARNTVSIKNDIQVEA